MENILSRLNITGANIVIYIAIVLVFLLGIVLCVVPIMSTEGQLKRAVAALRKKSGKRGWQEETFLGKGKLQQSWSAYLKNLRFSDGVYHATASVEDFINEDSVIYGPGRTSFSDALPGIMVSLGFLGTLIGLSAGLSGFDMTDATAAQSSIQVLIPNMKYAFVTSIFGVVGSVLFTMITRGIYGSAERTIDRFYKALEQCTGIHSVDPLTQMATYQQEQNDLMRIMSQDLNGQFSERLQRIVMQSMQPMVTTMQEFMAISTKEQARFMDALVNRYVERLDTALDGQLSAFSGSVAQSMKLQQAAMADLMQGMDATKNYVRDVQALSELSTSLQSAMKDYMASFAKAQEKTAEDFNRVASTVEQMDMISRQQNAYLKNLATMNSDIRRSIDSMTGAVSALYERMVDENEASAQNMLRAGETLKQMMTRMENMQKQSLHVIEAEMNTTMREYQTCADQFMQSIDRLSDGLTHAIGTLPQDVARVSDAIIGEVEKMSGTLADAQRLLDDTVDKMYRG